VGNIAFEHPWALLALPLAVLPWIVASGAPARIASLGVLPDDPLSRWLLRALKAITSIGLAALVCALAAPYHANVTALRTSRGAEIAILFDKSRSMDEKFGARNDDRHWSDGRRKTKGEVARDLLAQFAVNRPDDRFALILFSTFPMPVMGFTRAQAVIQAAIAATQTERGLSDTDIGRALDSGLDLFENKPYAGSRILLLVSDGGARLDVDVRERLKARAQRSRVSIYWIYLRGFRSPGLQADVTLGADSADSVPEHFLHRYFGEIGVPYKAYESDEPDAMKRAVEDISRLENQPLRYVDALPRQPIADWFLGTALLATVLLAAAHGLTKVLLWRS
jgi:mxaC protein